MTLNIKHKKNYSATNRSMNVKNFCLHKMHKFAIIRLQRGTINKILDMTPTEKGRKIRRRELTKKLLIIFVFSQILSIISNLPVIFEGWTIFVSYLLETLLVESILIGIFGIYLYKKQEKEVKKLNEKN